MADRASSPATQWPPLDSYPHLSSSNGAKGPVNSPGKLSFAAMAARSTKSPRFPEIQLAARQYGTKDGVPSITFTAAEFQAASQRFAHTLVAKFQIGRPPFEIVKRTMLAAWNIEGRITISSNWDDRHIVIILDSDKDVNSVLTSPLRKIGHTMFRVFRWTPDYNPKKESTTVTKWIRFPGLPMEMFDRAILRSIVSSFALFLDIDAKTKEMDSLSFARACVEINVSNPVPSKVWINLPDNKGFFQDIVIEGGLRYCAKCNIHGHDLTSCKKVSRNAEIKDVNGLKHTDKGSTLSKVQDNSGQPTKNQHLPDQAWRIVESRKNKGKYRGFEAPLKEDSTNQIEKDTVNEDTSPHEQDVEQNIIPAVIAEIQPIQAGADEQIDMASVQGDQPLEQSDPAMASVGQEDDPVVPVSAVDTYKELSNVAQGDQPSELNFDGQASTAVVNKGLFHMVLDGNQVVHSQELDDYVKRAKEDGNFEAFLKFCKENGYILPFGSSVPVDEETTHNSNYELCSQDDNTTRMPIPTIPTRTRNRKKSRSSTRSCPKQKDTNFVWP